MSMDLIVYLQAIPQNAIQYIEKGLAEEGFNIQFHPDFIDLAEFSGYVPIKVRPEEALLPALAGKIFKTGFEWYISENEALEQMENQQVIAEAKSWKNMWGLLNSKPMDAPVQNKDMTKREPSEDYALEICLNYRPGDFFEPVLVAYVAAFLAKCGNGIVLETSSHEFYSPEQLLLAAREWFKEFQTLDLPFVEFENWD